MSSTCQELLTACAEGQFSVVRYLLQNPKELDFNPSECKDESGSSLLHIACRHGHSDIVAFLIGEGFSVNCQDNEGNTPLHVSCYFSALECTKCLLQARCDATLANVEGLTAQTIPFSQHSGDMLLHVACRRLDMGILKFLIDEEHYEMNTQNREGDSALHIACKSRRLNVVQYLLSLDHCDVKFLNQNGDTPLHVACESGDVEIVKSLTFEMQYDMNKLNKKGDTPLHVACNWKNLEVVKYLTRALHCDTGLQNKNGNSLLHVACRSRCFNLVQYLVSLEHCNTNVQNNRGDTPLHIACKKGDVEIVKSLACEGQHYMNVQNEKGNTPLHVAVIYCKWVKMEVVKSLISEQHCDMNIQNKVGNTPLHLACYHRGHSVIKYLLEQRCKTNLVNRDSITPQMIPLNKHGDLLLHLACQWGEVEMVRYLVTQERCDVNVQNRNGDKPLHIACTLRTADIVKYLRDEIDDMNVQNKEGNTPLHIACYHMHKTLSVIRYLLEQKCKTNLKNWRGRTPQTIALNEHGDKLLHVACQWGNVEIVKYLVIEEQGDVNVQNQNSNTPIHVACRWANLDIVVFLVSGQHCDMNVQNRGGNTPLHIACYFQALSVIKCLLEQRCKTNLKNRDGETPQTIPLNDDGGKLLHIACQWGEVELVRYLVIEQHCDMNVQNRGGNTPLHIACYHRARSVVKCLLEQRCNTNLVNRDGTTPQMIPLNKHGDLLLHLACQWGEVEMVRHLVTQEQCDVNVQNRNGDKPLHIACTLRTAEMVKYLRDEIDDMNVQNKEGNTPLHIACYHKARSVIKYLLEQRCKTNLKNRCGRTPQTIVLNEHGDKLLHVACQWGKVEIVKYLIIEEQGDVNVQNQNSNTPLHVACRRGNLDIVVFLVSEQHCDINVQNRGGNTPLHIACYFQALSVIKCLLEQRCKINLLNRGGTTPQTIPLNDNGDMLLHVACQWSDVDIVRYLIDDEQCDINVQNMNGDLPLHIACKWGNLKVVEYMAHEVYHHLNIQNKEGNTPFHIACYSGYLTVIMFLLEQRCSTKDMNQSNHTPQTIPINNDGDVLLHLACRCGKISIVKYLVGEEDCDINAPNMKGDCPIHVVCAQPCENVDIVKYLIGRDNCDVNVKNNAGLAPLHITIKMHGATVATYFLEHPKCELTLPDSDGNTPLHLACMAVDQDADFLSVARLLLASTSVNPSCVNNAGQTPVELTTNYQLIQDIAYFTECQTKHAIQTYIKIFFIGNPLTGKSTLVKAICREASKWWKLLPSPLRRVRNVPAHTAGIIPIMFRSKTFGNTVLYDMAGQYEYYSSHAAVIQSTVLCSPPAFIVFADLSESEGQILEKLKYWWSFLDNVAARAIAPPHIILVGSHADVVKSRGENVHEKMESISKVIQRLSSTLHFAGQIALDCRDPVSRKLSNFCSLVDQSCTTFREAADIDLHCHILYAFLLEHFGDQVHVACTISDVATLIKEAGALLPQNTMELVSLVSSLSDRALILLVHDHTSIEDSWIIFQKQALLTEISGTLFAPENFRQHRDFARSTGVVPFSRIKREFPQHDANMVVGFLTDLEFCFKIDDPQTLQRIEDEAILPEATLDPSDEYYFFPALVSVENPLQVWQPDDTMTYQCGWYYECSQNQFLTTRFLHVLILRLAFLHALALNSNHLLQHSPVICRRCSVWKHGIGWLRDGIETAVEVGLQCQYVTVMMQCRKEKEIKCAQLRASIICEVVKAKEEFCPAVKLFESIIHPSCISYPFISRENISIHNITDIARAITDKETDIVDQRGLNMIALSTLLAFEPYLYVSPELLNELFAVDNSEKPVPEPFLARFAGHVYSQMPLYEKAIAPQPAIDYQEDLSRESLQARKCLVLLKWLLRQLDNPTYENFHKELDKFSIFCGRNPMVSEHSPKATDHCDCFPVITLFFSFLCIQDVANAKVVVSVQHIELGSLRYSTHCGYLFM